MATSWDIQGGTTPILRFNVEAGESVHVQSGSYMSGGTDMKGEKVDARKTQKVGLAKRYFSGDFITWEYKNDGESAQSLDVSPKSAGAITAISCQSAQDGFLMENGAFFAMSDGICEISTQSTKQLRQSGAIAGLLSQGFTMQKLVPVPAHDDVPPTLFVESSGKLIQHDLAEGEQLKVNKSALFGFSNGTKMELRKVESGRLRHIWAGEGFSNYVATGPGTVFVESHAKASSARKQESGISKAFWGVIGVIGIGIANVYFIGDDGNNSGNPLEAEEKLGNAVIEFFMGDDEETLLPPPVTPELDPN